MNRRSIHTLVRPILLVVGLVVGFGGVALVGIAVGTLMQTDFPSWPVTDAGLLSIALGGAVVALGVAYPVPEATFGGRLRLAPDRQRRVLVTARATVSLVGVGYVALGVLALIGLVVHPSGDIFVLGLTAAFAVLELLVGLFVLAGGFAIPAPDDTAVGRVLQYSTQQRRVVGTSLGALLLLATAASLGSVTGIGPLVPFVLGAGGVVAYVAVVSTFFWRLGEAVVGGGSPVR